MALQPEPVAPGAIPPALEQELAHLLEQNEDEAEAALVDLCARFPEHASILRSGLARLRGLGIYGGDRDRSEPPERLGEFRLLAKLGGGGMGVVYLAHQPALGREVALKLIRPEQLYFPGARERFLREVDAVARLQHPGIVPIITFGEERSSPYLAMERIPGASLTDVLRELPRLGPEELRGAHMLAAVRRSLGGAGPGADGATDEPAFFRGSWVDVSLRVVLPAG